MQQQGIPNQPMGGVNPQVMYQTPQNPGGGAVPLQTTQVPIQPAHTLDFPVAPPAYPLFLKGFLPLFVLDHMYMTSVISFWGLFLALSNFKLSKDGVEVQRYDIYMLFLLLLAASSSSHDSYVASLSWLFLFCTLIGQLLEYMETYSIGIKDVPQFNEFSPRIRKIASSGTNLIAIAISATLLSPSTATPANFHNVPTHLLGLYGLWQCVLCVHLPHHISKFRNSSPDGEKEQVRKSNPGAKNLQQSQKNLQQSKKNGSLSNSQAPDTIPPAQSKMFIEPYSMFLYLLLSSLTLENSLTRLLTLSFLFSDIAIIFGNKIGKPVPFNYVFNSVSVLVGLLTSIWVICEVNSFVSFPVSGRLVSLYGIREIFLTLPDISEGAPLTDLFKGKLKPFSRVLFMLLALVASDPQLTLPATIKTDENAPTNAPKFGPGIEGLQIMWLVSWAFFFIIVIDTIFVRVREMTPGAISGIFDKVIGLLNGIELLLGAFASLWVMVFA
jgi:hypothetical protein